MKSLFGASLSLALAALLTTSASAADLPAVKLTAGNKVPACASPDRLTAYLKERNPRLDPRFANLAALYKQHGEALGIRWDVAFFQMILETGALRFTGDVRPDQNNFAGLGASGGGARGERFADVSTGVKAHLQHLLMYAGEHIDDPVADRTRKVQEWGVLTSWQKSIDGPMTYTLVAKQWAPTSRNYVRDVTAISDGFYSGYCNAPDPDGGLVQEASASEQPAATATASGADIAKRNIEAERNAGGGLQSLGASMLASTSRTATVTAEAQQAPQAAPEQAAPEEDSPPVTLLNAKSESAPAAKAPPAGSKQTASKSDTKSAPKSPKADKTAAVTTKSTTETKSATEPAKSTNVQTASINSAATQLKIPPAKSGKCKVWTASYGGQRAVIIKAGGTDTVNYTVLDVTDANEKREVDAYIAAYAKGGEKIGSFPSQTKALTKAFELCPEG